MTFTDDSSNSKQITGLAFIGSMSISGPISDFAQCSISLKGTGAYDVQTTVIPTPTDYETLSDWWQTVNANTFVNGASSGEHTGTMYTLADTDILLEVSMEGTQYDIITSGTPTGRTCKYVSVGKVQFPADVIFDGSQRVFVEWKRPI